MRVSRVGYLVLALRSLAEDWPTEYGGSVDRFGVLQKYLSAGPYLKISDQGRS